MKFENLFKLLNIIKDKLESQDYFFGKFDHGYDAIEKFKSTSIAIY